MPASLPAAFFRASYADLAEGQSGMRTMLFTVELSFAPETTTYVSVASFNGSANAGEDYTARSARLTFAAGETVKSLGVQLLSDTLHEANETFTVAITQVTGGGVIATERTSALGTIVNDDPVATPEAFLVADTVSLAEGQSGTRSMTFTIGLTEAPVTTVRVNFATSNGTAVAGDDYTARTGFVSFAPGETRKALAVALRPDTTPEPDETFDLALTSVTGGGVLGPDRTAARGTIVNDDAETLPTAAFTSGYAETAEGQSGSRNLIFTVVLSAAPLATARVGFTTASGGATAGEDYVTRTGQLTFAVGETRKTFGVTVLGDTVAEADETFYPYLTSATGGAVLAAETISVVATIVNDDVF